MRLTCARLPSATASPPPSPRATAAGGASASLRSKAPSPSRCSTPSRSAPCSRSTGSASGRSASRAPAAASSSRAARALSPRIATSRAGSTPSLFTIISISTWCRARARSTSAWKSSCRGNTRSSRTAGSRKAYTGACATAPTAQLAEEFRALLRDGVRRTLARPHRKLGNFLSGGTDSSTLAGLVTELTGTPAETYSIGFDAPGYDESHYADIAVQHFGTRHHTYYVTPQDVVDAIPLIARQYDEPCGNASAVPTYYCAKMAKEDGVDLMIAGDGGDELFGGNARYVKQKTFELYYNVPAALRRALIEPLAFHIPGADSVAPLRKRRSYITQARVPLPDRLESYNFLHRSPARDIFDAAFLEHVDVGEPVRNLREVSPRTDGADALYRMLHLDLKVTLADSDLRKVNRMCEAAGVGVSYPLLDDAMVEFSGRVPADLMIKGYTLRYYFKDSLM